MLMDDLEAEAGRPRRQPAIFFMPVIYRRGSSSPPPACKGNGPGRSITRSLGHSLVYRLVSDGGYPERVKTRDRRCHLVETNSSSLKKPVLGSATIVIEALEVARPQRFLPAVLRRSPSNSAPNCTCRHANATEATHLFVICSRLFLCIRQNRVLFRLPPPPFPPTTFVSCSVPTSLWAYTFLPTIFGSSPVSYSNNLDDKRSPTSRNVRGSLRYGIGAFRGLAPGSCSHVPRPRETRRNPSHLQGRGPYRDRRAGKESRRFMSYEL